MAAEEVCIVFDKLPRLADGGMAAAYMNFVEEFEVELDVRLVSVFEADPTDIPAFKELEGVNLVPFRIDHRFPYALEYLKEGNVGRFAFALWSALLFFLAMPLAKWRSWRLLAGKAVIASSPAAAAFLSKKLAYILEVHTDYDYFWGDNLVGRIQGALVPVPQLALFRNSIDAAKASQRFRSGYIHNCFDHHAIAPAAADAAGRGHSALFMGRLASQKNPLRLVRCAALLRERMPDFTLDIYGDGELRDEVEKAIESAGLNDCVRLRGFTSDKEVYRRYSLLWMTSACEGFGLALIEAMANGTPVVTTHWGDAAFEVVRQGETGFVAETDEEFVACSFDLLDDSEKLAAFSRNALDDFRHRFTRAVNKQAWHLILDEEFGLGLS